MRTTVPFHVDAAGRSQRVEAVEDPVARYLDSPHWKNKENLEMEDKQKQPRVPRRATFSLSPVKQKRR